MAKSKTPPQMTPQNLQAMIHIEKQTRAERCLAEIQAAINPILKKHNCDVVATPVIVDGRIVANWGVRPNDLPAPPTS